MYVFRVPMYVCMDDDDGDDTVSNNVQLLQSNRTNNTIHGFRFYVLLT